MMRVDPSQSAATSRSHPFAAAKTPARGGAFASLLKTESQARAAASTPSLGSAQLFAEPTRVTASAATTTPGATTATTAATTTTTPAESTTAAETSAVEAADKRTAPKNETTRPVEGHKYSEILSGPRNGMYLNQSGNERDGMAFVLVKRNGRTFHVYGSGKDRLVCEVRHKPKTAETTTPTPPTQAPATTTPTTPTTTPTTPSTSTTPAGGGVGDVPQANPSSSQTSGGITG